MADSSVSLRPYQIDDLALYLNNPRFLNLSDPGTGKTASVCVYLWYIWSDLGKRSIWSMPKSLLKKNRMELLRFTDFEPEDVVILETDWAPVPKDGTTLPTKERSREEQISDEVIITKPAGAPCNKGDIVPLDVAERWDGVKFEYNWEWEVTNAGGLDLPVGTRIRSDLLKQIRAEIKGTKVKAPKLRRLFQTRPVTDTVIDTIAAAREAKVFLVSFHFLRNHWQTLMDTIPTLGCLAVDELHMAYGSIDSANTQSLFGVMNKCSHFIGMTGTLLNGRLDSVYPAIHVIEPRYYGSYAGFRNQHVAFEDSFGRVLSWKEEWKVGTILLKHGIRRTFEEVYGKEDVVFQTDLCFMTDQMRSEYDLFHEQAMLELSDGRFLDGSLPGVATIRARQIMSHPETFGLCADELTGKDERLLIHLEDAKARGEHMLIFSVFVPEQERIVALLRAQGRRVGLMNGATSSKQRDLIDQQFRAGQLDDVVGSPETMAVGWNWEHVDHVIGVSYGYLDVDWLQAYRRASRGTRTKTLRVTLFQYYDSVDKRALQIICEKSKLANRVDPSRPVLDLAA